MGVAARWRFTTRGVLAIAGCVLLAGCGRYPIAAEGASPSAAASQSAAGCVPLDVPVAGLQGVDHGPSGLDDDVGAGCRIARADWEPDPVTVGRCPLHAALSLGFGRM
jgi:hypothetical protein